MTQCFSIRWFWAFRETYLDQNVSFKIQLSKHEHEAPSTNRLCSKLKDKWLSQSGKKVTFVKWQERSWKTRKWRYQKSHWWMFKIHEFDKWAIRQLLCRVKELPKQASLKLHKTKNGTTKSKKVLSVSRQIQWSKFDVDFIDLNLLHKGSYWLFWT